MTKDTPVSPIDARLERYSMTCKASSSALINKMMSGDVRVIAKRALVRYLAMVEQYPELWDDDIACALYYPLVQDKLKG